MQKVTPIMAKTEGSSPGFRLFLFMELLAGE
jgi:hypothetical protein